MKSLRGYIGVSFLSATCSITSTSLKPSLKIHQHKEQGCLTVLFTFHIHAHLLSVHCMLKAVLSYFTALFNLTVTMLYLEKLNRFREAFLKFKQWSS